jgi:hypothetical protein
MARETEQAEAAARGGGGEVIRQEQHFSLRHAMIAG